MEDILPFLLSQVKSLEELIITVASTWYKDPSNVWPEVDRILGESRFSVMRKVTIEFFEFSDEEEDRMSTQAPIIKERLPLCAARGILNFKVV
jgi:hypothetical protein